MNLCIIPLVIKYFNLWFKCNAKLLQTMIVLQDTMCKGALRKIQKKTHAIKNCTINQNVITTWHGK